jgi:plasmid stabilization system protein ParE
VATVVYSSRALAHLERAFEHLRSESSEHLRSENPDVALAAAAAIHSAVESLTAHPLLGRRIQGDIRELVISYGQTGYIALYRFVVSKDEVRILAIRHQREIGFVP